MMGLLKAQTGIEKFDEGSGAQLVMNGKRAVSFFDY
jgi:hypothetical protein